MMTKIATSALILFALGLAGCARGKYIATEFFLINPEVNVTPVASEGVSLAVRDIDYARFYKQPIVYRDDDYSVGQYTHYLWSEIPADLVSRALVDATKATGRFKDVGRAVDMSLPDYIMKGNLRQFELIRFTIPWEAHCVLELEVRNVRTGEAIWQGLLEARQPLKENDVTALPEAMSLAVADIVSQAVTGISAAAIPSAN